MKKKPLFFNPEFYHGSQELNKLFNSKYLNTNKKAMIIEIGHIAGYIHKYLDKAPIVHRGR